MEKTENKSVSQKPALLLVLPVAVACALLFSSCETTSTVGTALNSSNSVAKSVAPVQKDKKGRVVAVPIMLEGVNVKASTPEIVKPKPLPRSNGSFQLASAGTASYSPGAAFSQNTPFAAVPRKAVNSTLRPSSAPNGGVMMVRTTAYCHKESDHIAYGNLSAAGSKLKYGGIVRSAAADWSKYPVGTRFRITGLPYEYVVDDYGSALVGTGTIDIYQPSFAAMNAWGVRNVPIQVIQWGSFQMSHKILSERKHVRHADHVRTMLREIERNATRSASVGSGHRKTGSEV